MYLRHFLSLSDLWVRLFLTLTCQWFLILVLLCAVLYPELVCQSQLRYFSNASTTISQDGLPPFLIHFSNISILLRGVSRWSCSISLISAMPRPRNIPKYCQFVTPISSCTSRSVVIVVIMIRHREDRSWQNFLEQPYNGLTPFLSNSSLLCNPWL